MKPLLWILLVAIVGIACGIVGFKVGVGRGAEAIEFMVAQTAVSDGIHQVRTSLPALEGADPSVVQHSLEQDITRALVLMGSHPDATWHCSDQDHDTMNALRAYVGSHPDLLDASLKPITTKGLAWCDKAGQGG